MKVTAVSRMAGKKIREIRARKKPSQEEVALRAGLNRAYIGYIERGERNPSTETLSKIAKALKVNLQEIFKF